MSGLQLINNGQEMPMPRDHNHERQDNDQNFSRDGNGKTPNESP